LSDILNKEQLVLTDCTLFKVGIDKKIGKYFDLETGRIYCSHYDYQYNRAIKELT